MPPTYSPSMQDDGLRIPFGKCLTNWDLRTRFMPSLASSLYAVEFFAHAAPQQPKVIHDIHHVIHSQACSSNPSKMIL